MSRVLNLFAALAFHLVAIGQPQLPPDRRVDLNNGYKNLLEASGQFDYNANTVFNELPLALYRGGTLSRDLRQRSADALREKGNVSGYVIEGAIQWTGAACWPSKPTWRPLVRIGHHDLAGLSFTADQYMLTFFGNAAYEGRTALLAPSAFEQVRYQTVGFGITDGAQGSFVRLDLVRGNTFALLDADWATLYTGTDGRVLRSAVLGRYQASDTSSSDLSNTHGLGATLAARWAFTTRGSEAIRFSVGVDQLGFIAWNKNTVGIEKDTLIRYEGWQVADLFALDDVLLNEDAVLDTFGLRYEHGPAVRLAPFHLRADASMAVGTDWQARLSVEHRHLPGYRPQGTALLTRLLGERTMVGATLNVGGFGAWRFGVSAKRRLGDHVLLTLSTPQLAGLATARVRGLGLMLGCMVGF